MTQVPGSPCSPGEQLVLPRRFLLSQGLRPPCLFLYLAWEGQHLEHTPEGTDAVPLAESKPIHRVREHFFGFLMLYGGWSGKGKPAGDAEAVLGSKKQLLPEAVPGATPAALQSSATSAVPPLSWRELWPLLGPPASGRPPPPLGHDFCESLETSSWVARERFAIIRCWDHEIPNWIHIRYKKTRLLGFIKRKRQTPLYPRAQTQPDSKRLEDHCYISSDFRARQELHSGCCHFPSIFSGFCLI